MRVTVLCASRYEVSFAEDLAHFMGAMECATSLIEGGQEMVVERLDKCKEFESQLEQAKGKLCTGQFDLIQRSKAAPR